MVANLLYLALLPLLNRGHHNISAQEMAGMGIGAAALICFVGYLLLRRRNSDQV